MYCSATSRGKARNPEFRSGMVVWARYDASLRMNHFAGTGTPWRPPPRGSHHPGRSPQLLDELGDGWFR